MWLSRAIDLKFRLVLRIVALAAFCFLATFAYTLIESDRSTRARADWIAQIVAKDLTLQQDQHHWVKFADNGFPDLQTIATPLMTPGVCIAYRTLTGETLQRLCSGIQANETGVPRYFTLLYSHLFKPDAEAVREVVFNNTPRGAAVVTFDANGVIAQAWQDLSRLLTVMAITLAA
ncbi:MAG TPA: histidine kinase, partial [Methylovirgula sp.]